MLSTMRMSSFDTDRQRLELESSDRQRLELESSYVRRS